MFCCWLGRKIRQFSDTLVNTCTLNNKKQWNNFPVPLQFDKSIYDLNRKKKRLSVPNCHHLICLTDTMVQHCWIQWRVMNLWQGHGKCWRMRWALRDVMLGWQWSANCSGPWYLLQCWFVNPGSNSPEVSLIWTKSVGTNFLFWTDGWFSNS